MRIISLVVGLALLATPVLTAFCEEDGQPHDNAVVPGADKKNDTVVGAGEDKKSDSAVAAGEGSKGDAAVVSSAEGTPNPEAKAGGKPAEEKPGAPIWQISENPRPANVSLADGKKLEKVWIEMTSTGAWVTHEGHRYWYLKNAIAGVEYIEGEVDEKMKRSLELAMKASAGEQKRQKQVDEAEKVAAAGSESASDKEEGKDAGRAPDVTSIRSRDGGNAEGLGVAGANAGEAQAGPGGGGDLDRNRGRHHGRGVYVEGAGKVSGAANASGTSAGSSGDAVQSGASGNATDHANVTGRDPNLAVQWRVKWVNRNKGLIRIKNRLIQKALTLAVKDPNDLEHVRKDDIMTGSLTVENPTLQAPDGTPVEFAVQRAGGAGDAGLKVMP